MLMGLEWNTNPGLWDINGGYDVCVYIYIYMCVCVRENGILMGCIK